MNGIDPELLSRYLKGEVDPESRVTVESWMEEHKLDRDFLHKVINPTDGVRVMMTLDAEKDWQKVRDQFPRARPMFLFYKVAASVVLAIGVALAILKFTFFAEPEFLAVSNDQATVREFTLPDQSVVFLNTGAVLEYQEEFQNNRNIRLKGEAFFDVHRDEQHPFVIQNRNGIVKVLGTSFSVQSDSLFTEVIVKEGRVSYEKDDRKLVLTADQRAYYDLRTDSLFQTANNSLNSFAWQTNVLIFENTALDVVAGDLSKYFNVNVRIDRKNGGRLPAFTSTFENPGLEEVLNEMKDVLPIEYKVTDNIVAIKILE